MSRLLVALFFILSFSYTTSAQTQVSGEIFGEWNKAGSPYVLVGNCIVPDGEQLWIKPGVTVRFKPPADGITLTIKGNLVAAGEVGDSIIFTSNALRPTTKDWGTIVADSGSALLLSYCRFNYYNPAITFRTGREATIKDSRFVRYDLTKGGQTDTIATSYAVGGSMAETLTITDCEFDGLTRTKDGISVYTDGKGHLNLDTLRIHHFLINGIYAKYTGNNPDPATRSVVVSNSQVNHAVTGVLIDGGSISHYLLEDNQITDCGNGLMTTQTYYCNPMIISNDIFNNALNGVYMYVSSSIPDTVTFRNNRVHHCDQGISVRSAHNEIDTAYIDMQFNTIAYCWHPVGTGWIERGLFRNNIVAFNGRGPDYYWNLQSVASNLIWNSGKNTEGALFGASLADLFVDPLFRGEYDLHLQWNSPAIDRADSCVSVGDEPEPNGGRANIGGYGTTSEAMTSPQEPIGPMLGCYIRSLRFNLIALDSSTYRGFVLGNFGDKPLQLNSFVLSDSVNFHVTGFEAQEMQPLALTPEFIRIVFAPKVAKKFTETLTFRSDAGEVVITIEAQSTGQPIFKTGSLPKGTTILRKEKSPYIIYGQVWTDTKDTLIIEPGVSILMADENSYLQSRGVLFAEGKANDSIYFDMLSGKPTESATIGNFVSVATGRLKYVNMQNFGGAGSALGLGDGKIFASDIRVSNGLRLLTDGVSIHHESEDSMIVQRIMVSDYRRGFNLSLREDVENHSISNLTSINNNIGVGINIYLPADTLLPPRNLLENSIIADNDIGINISYSRWPETFDTLVIGNLCLWNNHSNNVGKHSILGPVLNSDPMFVGSPTYPYSLDPHSPCIDAGNPDSPLDPDSSRADIGAWTFDHNNRPAVVARLEPQDAELECDVDQEVLFDVLGDDPEEWTLDYLWLVDDSTFWGGSTLKWTFAESGEYMVAVQAFDGFNFSGTVDWLVRVAPLDGKPVDALPADFAIHSVYPNPFNDLATLRYTLPGAGVVELTVYDVQGRALLYNRDIRSAGGTVTRVLYFGDYPAGLYFLRMSYGGKVEYRKLVYIR